MPDLRHRCLEAWFMELKQLSRDHHSGSFKKDAAQKAVLGPQV
jgi:hypothetical protein